MGLPNLAIGWATNHLKFGQGVLQYQKMCQHTLWCTFPLSLITLQDHEALRLRIFANKIKRGQKGVFEDFHLLKTNTPTYACAFQGQYILCMEMSSKLGLSLNSALWQHWGHLVKERGANNWASQTWHWWSYKSPQIWPRCVAVPENVPHAIWCTFPLSLITPPKITKLYICEYSQTKSKGVKRGVFEDFHLSETNNLHMHAHFKGEIKPKVANLHQGVVKWLPIVS